MQVKISEPNNSGLMHISFSQPLPLPASMTTWSSRNEGSEYLKIQYEPTEENVWRFEDYEFSM